MEKLSLNGHSVAWSPLTSRTYRAAPCRVLLNVTPGNFEEAFARFIHEGTHGQYSGLRVDGLTDLSFLERFPLLLYLEVLGRNPVDLSPLRSLNNLRGLRVETPGSGIDFSWFPEIEVFTGTWHRDNVNVDAARELRSLHVWQFRPKSADMSPLAGAVRLEVLQVIQTNLTSLNGVERLEDLRKLEVAYAPKLKSLDAFAKGDVGIRELEFEASRSIESFKPIGKLAFLRNLRVSGCADMPDLKWARTLSRLEFFSFVNTNVRDGNVRALLDLPAIRYVGTLDKRHFNMKFKEIEAALEARWGRR